MSKSKIAKIIEILFKIILIIGIISIPFIPKLYTLLKIFGFKDFYSQSLLYQIIFYLCYIICLGIIFILNYMFKIIYQDNPFNKKIENSLKIIAALFMTLSILILIKTLYIPTILSIAIIVVTFITSLCFYVLSQIIKAAITYKNEVDYTI